MGSGFLSRSPEKKNWPYYMHHADNVASQSSLSLKKLSNQGQKTLPKVHKYSQG
jgi:hypothetical protein